MTLNDEDLAAYYTGTQYMKHLVGLQSPSPKKYAQAQAYFEARIEEIGSERMTYEQALQKIKERRLTQD